MGEEKLQGKAQNWGEQPHLVGRQVLGRKVLKSAEEEGESRIVAACLVLRLSGFCLSLGAKWAQKTPSKPGQGERRVDSRRTSKLVWSRVAALRGFEEGFAKHTEEGRSRRRLLGIERER